MGIRGREGPGVDVVVTLDVRAEIVVSSLARLLVDAFDIVLALPGDLVGDVRSTKELISTLTTGAGPLASS